MTELDKVLELQTIMQIDIATLQGKINCLLERMGRDSLELENLSINLKKLNGDYDEKFNTNLNRLSAE